MSCKIGFTGSRFGMTPKQVAELLQQLKRLQPSRVDHGACIGADEQFLLIVDREFPDATTAAHPSTLKTWTTKLKSDIEYPLLPPLERNKEIVKECDILIACPAEKQEQLRSGTWSTIRYARKMKKEYIILEP